MPDESRPAECPRCGRARPPDAGTRFCVHCGRSLAGMTWVADVPEALRPGPPAPPRRRYTGPPRYHRIPRWSLWPWAPTATGPDLPAPEARSPGDELRRLAVLIEPLARTTAVLAVIAALAEVWRYVLLVDSRDEALSPIALAFSDTLVTLVGLLTPVAAVVTGLVFLLWLVRGRAIAGELSGTEPSRGTVAVVVGSILPGPNLTVPGSALAEMEHAASGRPPGGRPHPSAPVARWWVAWGCSVVLGVAAVLRGLGTSTQAMADSVLLHGLADVAAAAVAVVTIPMVEHLTALLAPRLRDAGREHVVALR